MQDFNVSVDLGRIAQDLQIRKAQVEAVVHLLDAGFSIPFLARYRRDQIGNLGEPVLRAIRRRLAHQRHLAQRKRTILKSIHVKGKLTEELHKAILAADTLHRLDDLFLPFKPKKASPASPAREKGLEPLAQAIWERDPVAANLSELLPTIVDPDKGLDSPEAVLSHVRTLLAERMAELPEVRDAVRRVLWDTGRIVASPAEGLPLEQAEEVQRHLPQPEPIRKIPPHRLLALNRGEVEKRLSIRIECDTAQAIQTAAQRLTLADHPHADLLRGCLEQAVLHHVLPDLYAEVRRDLTERAEEQAVEILARNLQRILLQPPYPARAVLALYPVSWGVCTFAVLDAAGHPLEHGQVRFAERRRRKHEAKPPQATPTETPVQPMPEASTTEAHPPTEAQAPATAETVLPGDGASPLLREQARKKLAELIRHHRVEVLALAQAAGSKALETLVAELIRDEVPEVGYLMVNAAGIQRYASGTVGREEFPDLPVDVRSVIAVGRRLLNPLSEWVKVEPQHFAIGGHPAVGSDKRLREALSEVFESCVNQVGADLNQAEVPLLRYISGLNPLTARAIVEFRKQQGPFRMREQLRQVPGISEAVFTQAAGFLRIAGGDEALDATWIHPEHYAVARWLMDQLNYPREQLGKGVTDPELRAKLEALSREQVCRELNIGPHALEDILEALLNPRKDPREALPRPVPKRAEIRFEDLQPGQALRGTVVNVVDFGAFVDIGLRESGLVHISQLANRFIRSPHEVVSVGDVVTVWVLSLDQERRRVSLTMIPPGTPRGPEAREGRRQASPVASPAGAEPAAASDRGPRRRHRRRFSRPAAAQAGAPSTPQQTAQATPPQPEPASDAAAAEHGGTPTRIPIKTPRGKRPESRPRRPLPKLSQEALAGQVPLRTFAELMAYMQAKKQL